MAARILRVVFEVQVNSTQSRFRVPLAVLDLLRLPHNGSVDLVIRDRRTGRLLYGGTHPMISKAEVYGTTMKTCINPGQWLVVEASRR